MLDRLAAHGSIQAPTTDRKTPLTCGFVHIARLHAKKFRWARAGAFLLLTQGSHTVEHDREARLEFVSVVVARLQDVLDRQLEEVGELRRPRSG
jgi:hypothetical protein